MNERAITPSMDKVYPRGFATSLDSHDNTLTHGAVFILCIYCDDQVVRIF